MNGQMLGLTRISRHNSNPDLRTSIGEFMRSWNNGRGQANFLRTASRTAHLRRRRWPLCRTKTGKLFFFRQSSDPQQQQPKALEEEKPGLGLLAANQQQPKPNSLPLPQIRLQAKCIRSPFAPLPFDRPWGANRGGLGYAPVSRDEDLLPSCWFSFDSEDLERLHYKLQRRISRRRSLNRANCAFGDENPRRTQILEKYEKRLRGGMRRALSDQHIRFMDPKRDVEPEIRGQTSPKLAAQPPACFPGRAQKHKRVSFSSPSAAAGHQSAPTGGLNGGDLPAALHRQLSRNNSSMSLQEPKLAIRQPAKPILARKSSADSAVGPFRHRSGTDASTGHSDSFAIAISPMDYATFRAWRRGSRLSIDVLNGAGAISPAELDKVGKSRPGLRLGLASLGQVLKRMLADCLQQSRAPDFACFQQQKTVN